MATKKKNGAARSSNGASFGFEAKLWLIAASEGTLSCVVRCLVEMLGYYKIGNSQIVLAAPRIESGQWRTFHRAAL